MAGFSTAKLKFGRSPSLASNLKIFSSIFLARAGSESPSPVTSIIASVLVLVVVMVMSHDDDLCDIVTISCSVLPECCMLISAVKKSPSIDAGCMALGESGKGMRVWDGTGFLMQWKGSRLVVQSRLCLL